MPPPTAPKVPSVKTGRPPHPCRVKTPPPTLLGRSPAIRLPDAKVQVGVKLAPLLVWLAGAEMMPLASGAGTGLTVNGLALLDATPEPSDTWRLYPGKAL